MYSVFNYGNYPTDIPLRISQRFEIRNRFLNAYAANYSIWDNISCDWVDGYPSEQLEIVVRRLNSLEIDRYLYDITILEYANNRELEKFIN